MTTNHGDQDMTTPDQTPASTAPATTAPAPASNPAWRTKGTRQHRRTLIGATTVILLAVGGAGAAVAVEVLEDDDVTGEARDRASEAALAEVGGGTVTDVDQEDGEYEVEVRREDGTEVDVHLDESFGTIWVDGAPAGGSTAGGSSSDDDRDRDDRDEQNDRDRDDQDDRDDRDRADDADGTATDAQPDTGADADDAPLTADERDQAGSAALAETGEGEVTDVDRERSGFEVEVRLVDGSEVDVYLDGAFAVVAVEPDDAR